MESQFQNCSGFSDHQLKMINLTLSITGCVGMLIAAITGMALLCVKAYKTVLQRLFLYGVFSTMVHEGTHVASVEHHFHYDHQGQVCAHLGFLVNWTTWIICNFHMCIIAYLLFVVYTQVRGDPFPRLSRSKRWKRVLEAACVLLSIFLPVTILWVPYLSHEYGLDESWCWIKAFDTNCKSTGLSDKLIYGYSYFEAVGLVALLMALGITVVYCKLAARFADAKQLLRQVLMLVLAIVGFMIILNIMLGIDILRSSYTMEIYFAAAATINDLVFLGGYILTFYFPKCLNYARRRFTFQAFRFTFQAFRRREERRGEKEYGTFKESDRVSAPSNTEFQVQYTGEFTSVSQDNN